VGDLLNDSDKPSNPERGENEPVSPEKLGHPIGTLIIVGLYGLFFALAWLGIYLFEFLPRGAPGP
jgi:hypothetical protein